MPSKSLSHKKSGSDSAAAPAAAPVAEPAEAVVPEYVVPVVSEDADEETDSFGM